MAITYRERGVVYHVLLVTTGERELTREVQRLARAQHQAMPELNEIRLVCAEFEEEGIVQRGEAPDGEIVYVFCSPRDWTGRDKAERTAWAHERLEEWKRFGALRRKHTHTSGEDR